MFLSDPNTHFKMQFRMLYIKKKKNQTRMTTEAEE